MVMSEASLDIVQDVFTTLWTTQVEINGGSVLPQPVKCFLRHIICHVIILEIIVRIIPYLIAALSFMAHNHHTATGAFMEGYGSYPSRVKSS